MVFRHWMMRWSQPVVGCAVICAVGGLSIWRRQYDLFKIYLAGINVTSGNPNLGSSYHREIASEMAQLIGISNEELGRVIIFYTKLDSPTFFGCLETPVSRWLKKSWLPIGGIGLPQYYNNITLEDTSFEKFNINGKIVDIAHDTTEGIKFRHTMFLTEDALKFIIGRQLSYVKSNINLIKDYVTIGTAYIAYQIAFLGNRFLKFNMLNLPFRFMTYFAITGVTFLLKRELMEAYTVHIHDKADQVALLGSRTFPGGMEYYLKTIKRNKIMHNLGFKKEFSKLGNDIPGLIFNYSRVNNHIRLSKLLNPNSKK